MTRYQRWLHNLVSNGTKHVIEEAKKHFGEVEEVTKVQAENFLNEVSRKMQEAESFSNEHTYWWSVKTHAEDLVLYS